MGSKIIFPRHPIYYVSCPSFCFFRLVLILVAPLLRVRPSNQSVNKVIDRRRPRTGRQTNRTGEKTKSGQRTYLFFSVNSRYSSCGFTLEILLSIRFWISLNLSEVTSMCCHASARMFRLEVIKLIKAPE